MGQLYDAASGRNVTRETIEASTLKGLTCTPTYIFPDRRFHTGLLEEAELRRRLGLAPTELVPKSSAQKTP